MNDRAFLPFHTPPGPLDAGPAVPDEPAADAAAAETALLDDPASQAACTTWEEGANGARRAATQLRLSGLWCAGCAGEIERGLAAEAGVLDVRVNHALGRARVTWDPAATRLSRVVAAVRRLGYDAAPDLAANAAALRATERRSALWRLFVALFCMMQVMMYAAPLYGAAPDAVAPDLHRLLLWAQWLLCLPVVAFAAAPFFREAWRAARQRRIAMDLPVAIGIAVTFVASSAAAFDPGGPLGGETYFDSLTMFVAFLLGGRYLVVALQHRVAATLESALSRLPEAVRRLEPDGRTTMVAPSALRVGDRVHVLAGDAFPADGRLLDGATEADEALLTGESRPIAKRVGDEAIAGSLNLRAPVVQRVERLGAATRYQGIVSLLQRAMEERPPLVRAADRFAAPFLVAVLVLAAASGLIWLAIDPTRAIWVAVSVLIVTCPCALSLAAPSASLAASAALIRRGVWIQRVEALEALAGVDTVCFDKTGTLTDGQPMLASVELGPAAIRAGLDAAAVTLFAAGLASASTHPLSRALAAAAPQASALRWHDVREIPGRGLEGIAADGGRHCLGAAPSTLATHGATAATAVTAATAATDATDAIDATHATHATHATAATDAQDSAEVTFAGPDGTLARFVFTEALRADARATVDALKAAGLRVTLLSGDTAPRVRELADRLGIEEARGGATPDAKLAAIAALQAAGHRVAMVGDGLNDAPPMARADVAVAIGDATALTRARADLVLPPGRLADLPWARAIARRSVRTMRQNLAWAATYNATCVPLALFGVFPPWAAGLGMALSSLVVVLNSLRIDRSSNTAEPGPVGPTRHGLAQLTLPTLFSHPGP